MYEKLEKFDEAAKQFIDCVKEKYSNVRFVKIDVKEEEDFITYSFEEKGVFQKRWIERVDDKDLEYLLSLVYETFEGNTIEGFTTFSCFGDYDLSYCAAIKDEKDNLRTAVEFYDDRFKDYKYCPSEHSKEKFDRQLKKLLSFVEKIEDSNSRMFIKREDDIISYGLEDKDLNCSFKVTDRDLEKVYNTLISEYKGEVQDALTIDEDQIPTLYVMINDKPIITINSDNLSDYDWFKNPKNNDSSKINTKKGH